MNNPNDEINMGTCCACGGTQDVENLIMLDYRAPVPGTGWGCVVCHMGMNGALAVICDACLENETPIKYAIDGFLIQGRRILISELQPGYQHDDLLHQADHAIFN